MPGTVWIAAGAGAEAGLVAAGAATGEAETGRGAGVWAAADCATRTTAAAAEHSSP